MLTIWKDLEEHIIDTAISGDVSAILNTTCKKQLT